MTIGDNLKTIRNEKKLTQKELSDKMNISRSYLSDIENNRKNPSSKTLGTLSEKLNISMLYLTTGKKTLNDLTDEEKLKGVQGVHESFKENAEKMQSNFKKDIKEIIKSELSFAQTMYLSNAVNYLKNSNEDDIRTLAALITNLNKYNEAGEADDVTQAELLYFIESETKGYKEFLKQRYHYKGD